MYQKMVENICTAIFFITHRKNLIPPVQLYCWSLFFVIKIKAERERDILYMQHHNFSNKVKINLQIGSPWHMLQAWYN